MPPTLLLAHPALGSFLLKRLMSGNTLLWLPIFVLEETLFLSTYYILLSKQY